MAYYSAPFTFNFGTSLIDVDQGVTDVDCATLYTAIKSAQASEEGIIYDRIGSGSGLNALGPGVQVGLTLEVLGSWQLRFPDGNYIARIGGGNFIGGPSGDPIAYTAGVQTLLIQSAASTVVTTQGGGGGGGGATAQQVWEYATRTITANDDITAIKAKTDNLPAQPASRGEVSVVNEGVKKASLLVPHTGNLP